jgi:uncharacterized membrane protein
MDTKYMDSGQIALILCQLILGAAATFCAIMFWSRTRDAAWMFIIIGAIVAYIEIVYSILDAFGIGGEFFLIGSVSLIAFILPSLRMMFFIAAFLIMIIKQLKQK